MPAETTPASINACTGLLERLRRPFPAHPRDPPCSAITSIDMAAFFRVWLITRRTHRLDLCPTANLAGCAGSDPLRADADQSSWTLRARDNLRSVLRLQRLTPLSMNTENVFAFGTIKDLNLRLSVSRPMLYQLS